MSCRTNVIFCAFLQPYSNIKVNKFKKFKQKGTAFDLLDNMAPVYILVMDYRSMQTKELRQDFIKKNKL